MFWGPFLFVLFLCPLPLHFVNPYFLSTHLRTFINFISLLSSRPLQDSVIVGSHPPLIRTHPLCNRSLHPPKQRVILFYHPSAPLPPLPTPQVLPHTPFALILHIPFVSALFFNLIVAFIYSWLKVFNCILSLWAYITAYLGPLGTHTSCLPQRTFQLTSISLLSVTFSFT